MDIFLIELNFTNKKFLIDLQNLENNIIRKKLTLFIIKMIRQREQNNIL